MGVNGQPSVHLYACCARPLTAEVDCLRRLVRQQQLIQARVERVTRTRGEVRRRDPDGCRSHLRFPIAIRKVLPSASLLPLIGERRISSTRLKLIHFYSGRFDSEEISVVGTARVPVDRLVDVEVIAEDTLTDVVRAATKT